MIEQFLLALLGFFAIALTQYPDINAQAWAPVFGLLSQPLWFRATYKAKQWGMFALNFAYLFIWVTGLWIHKDRILGQFLSVV